MERESNREAEHAEEPGADPAALARSGMRSSVSIVSSARSFPSLLRRLGGVPG